MSLRSVLLMSVCCVAASVTLQQAALAQNSKTAEPLQITKPIYPWRTETQKTDDQKNFSHCLVKNMYDNGILLMIAENAAHQRRLAIHFPQDKAMAESAYNLEWQVDRQPTQNVTAIAASPRILAIAMDDVMTRQIGRGNMLFLRGPNDALVFDMLGVQDAIRSLQDCLVTNNVKPAPIVFSGVSNSATKSTAFKAPTPDTLAQSLPQKAVPVPAPVVADTKPVPAKSLQPAANSAVPQNLIAKLTAAGLAPKNVMRVPDNDRTERPFDMLWSQGALSIGLKTELPLPHQAMTQAAAKFSRQLQSVCNGEFLAEGGQVEKRGDTYIMPAEVACSPRDTNGKREPNTVSALLLVMDTRSLHILFIEAPEAMGPQAVQARDRLMAQYK